jgi:hypothetical protein
MGVEGIKARIAERKRNALEQWSLMQTRTGFPETSALFTPLAPAEFSYVDVIQRDKVTNPQDISLSRTRINAILTALKDAPADAVQPEETAGLLSPSRVPLSPEIVQSAKDSKQHA